MRRHSGIVRKFIETVVMATAMVFIMSAAAFAEDSYEVTIPATITLSEEGTGELTVGAEQSEGGRITMDLGSSLNNFHLKNNDDHLSYSITHKTTQAPVDTGDHKKIFVLESDESASTEETLSIGLNELATMYGGDYTDTLTFVVERKLFNPMSVEAVQWCVSHGFSEEAETMAITGQTGAVGTATYTMTSQTTKAGIGVSYFTFDAAGPTITKKANTPDGEYVVAITVHADGDEEYLTVDQVITVNVTVDSAAVLEAETNWFRAKDGNGTAVPKSSIGTITLLKADPEYADNEYEARFNADTSNKGKIVGYIIDPQDESGKKDLVLARHGYEEDKIYAQTSRLGIFSGFSSCVSIENLGYLDTSNVTNMAYMFAECRSLTALDVSGFDTSNVTNMTFMFSECSGLTALDVSSFDTSNAVVMSNMFRSCTGLTALDVSGFDTSNAGDMRSMFYNCSGLTALDVSGFDTSNVGNMTYMFALSGLITLDVSGFDTSKVTDMSAMFQKCSSLTTLDASGFDTSQVMYMDRMFQNCSKLNTIYASDAFTTDAVTNSQNMFTGCTALVGGNGTTTSGNPTDQTYARIDRPDIGEPGYFTLCEKPGYIVNIGNYDLPFNKESVTGILRAESLPEGVDPATDTTGNYINIGTDEGRPIWAWVDAVVDHFNIMYYCEGSRIVLPEDSAEMFYGFASVKEIDTTGWDTSEVTSMAHMFCTCLDLTDLDVSNFDTSNVTDMTGMFGLCTSLENLDVSNFDTSSVTGMASMFEGCAFTQIEINSFETSKVTDMESMFMDCWNLQNLDLSSFDTATVSDMGMMFSRCEELETIYASDAFTTDAVTSSRDMFSDCRALVGGNGTTTFDNPIDKTYARIDTTEAPGYFTAVEEPLMLMGMQRQTFSITFDKNKENAEGTMDEQAVMFGQETALSICTFTAPDGYEFAGWAETTDGDPVYGDGEEITVTRDDVPAEDPSLTLYAVWHLIPDMQQTVMMVIENPTVAPEAAQSDSTTGTETEPEGEAEPENQTEPETAARVAPAETADEADSAASAEETDTESNTESSTETDTENNTESETTAENITAEKEKSNE